MAKSFLKSLPFRSAIGKWLHGRRVKAARQACLDKPIEGVATLGTRDWPESLKDPTTFYIRCFQHFHRHLDAQLRGHREYFAREGRGFGEEAFHVLWTMLVRETRPERFLEIGIYRGQVISLVSLLQRQLGLKGTVTGISPFLPAGDSVSAYREDIDYKKDTLANFRHFDLPDPELLEAFSTDAKAADLIRSRTWDLIYIDGNHDEAVVRADWTLCSEHTRPGGMVVLDDSGLSSAYDPPAFATKGHPGPSRIASEIDPARFREVLQVGHNRVFQKLPA